MQKYIVGGYVRDSLLKKAGVEIEPRDKDWVVVGSSPEEMIKNGFIPVGAGFPVFINPRTQEEYALARTERKHGSGYHGFVFFADPSVTLEEDLLRRDLTINAMAFDEKGSLIDYHGGQKDLEEGVLRHVSFAFSEDPVRLLRLARFAARFPSFTVAKETSELLKKMVDTGETDHLVKERITQELLKALEEPKPSRFFDVAMESGYLRRSFEEWKISSETLQKIDNTNSEEQVLTRFVRSLSDIDRKSLNALLNKLRLPRDFAELAKLYVEYKENIPTALSKVEDIYLFVKRADIRRRPERFRHLLSAVGDKLTQKDLEFWNVLIEKLEQLDTSKIIAEAHDKTDIPSLIEKANLNMVKEVSDKFTNQ